MVAISVFLTSPYQAQPDAARNNSKNQDLPWKLRDELQKLVLGRDNIILHSPLRMARSELNSIRIFPLDLLAVHGQPVSIYPNSHLHRPRHLADRRRVNS